MMLWDVVVAGGGVAGLSAAFHAAGFGMRCLVVERLAAGGGACLAKHLDSLVYTGDGWSFARRLADAARERGAIIQEDEEVERVVRSGEELLVHTDSRLHRGRCVVVATGTGEKPLGVPGEERLRGRGVHYCAQCAGFAYRGRRVGVVGGDVHAVRAARFLLELASEVLVLAPEAGGERQLEALEEAGARVVRGARVLEFRGGERLDSVLVRLGEGVEEVELDGVFVYLRKPNSEVVEVEKDARGYIVVDSEMRTSEPGVLACGGVVGRFSVTSSLGDGATAAATAARRLGYL